LVTGIVAGLLIGKYIYTLKPTPSPIISASPTSVSTPDPTADWKTVSDTQVGVSFKYPENLLPYINTPQKSPDNLIFSFDAFNNVEKRDHRTLQEADLELEVIVYKQVKWSIESYLSAIKAADYTIVTDPFPGNSGSFTKVKTVSGEKIQKAIIYTEPKNEFAEYDAFLVDNSNMVTTIRLMTGSHDRKQELLSLLDQILSTFKFVDVTGKSCQSDADCGSGYTCMVATGTQQMDRDGKPIDIPKTCYPKNAPLPQ